MAGWFTVTGPGRWKERRYGLRLNASIATVPSFSPIGESADWYWNHLGTDVLRGSAPHISPLVEVLAHHRDRWSHVAAYDEFIPFLTFHRFDADSIVGLAVESGMGHVVQVAKHHDGFCWWDAPGTGRTSTSQGPHRDVVGEIAAACRRASVQFGTAYSLLDWPDLQVPLVSYVDQILHPQVIDLVERYGTQILSALGGGADTTGSGDRRIEELLDRARDLADAQGFELAINDGWGGEQPTFASLDSTVPAEIMTTPWEFCRPLGASFGYNRAERAEHLLSAGSLLDLLTEVISKGGSLMMDVGPSVDGTITEIQQRPLREVGTWVTDNQELIHGSRPFDLWGDALVRYMAVGEHVMAVDLAAGPEVVLAGLTPDRYEVLSVEADDGGSLHWEQHRGGVIVTRIDRSPAGLAGVYRIRLQPAIESTRLFEERAAEPRALQPLLDSAIAGDVIQLQEGRHTGPVAIPHGVILRGLGWDRTSIIGDSAHHGSRGAIVTLADSSRIENIHVSHGAHDDRHAPSVVVSGFDAAVVGCRCDGMVVVEGDDVTISAVVGPGVIGDSQRTTIERCTFNSQVTGNSQGTGNGEGWGTGVALTGGSGHRIHRNEIVGGVCALRLHDISASVVSENRLEARWQAVHLQRCDHVEVVDNSVRHSMRAIDIEGGNGSIVTGNWIADGDSGATIEFGATGTSIIDNHIERCRVGLVVWDAPTTLIGPNSYVDLHETDPVAHGPDAD